MTIAAPATDPGYVAFDGVAVQPDGTAVVAVRTSTGPRLYRKPLGGVVAAPIAVVPADSYFFDLQTDAAGNVHLAQGGDLSGIYLTRTRTLSPTGVLSAPIDVRPPSPDLYLAELVVAPDGTEHARLTDPAGGASYVALRPAGAGAFQAIQQVSGPDTGQTDMTVTPTGDSLVLWGRNVSPTDNRVMVGGIDSGVPPSLTDLAIPTATVAGTPVRLSVKAADHMGLSSVNWQFGDGTSGNGEAVTHAWGSPGTRTVTVTATDRAGNSASAQGTVTVVTPASSRPPRLRVALRAPRRISFARLRARGVRVVARVSKAARLSATLIGRARRARISRVGDLVLAQRAARRGRSGRVRMRLKPRPRLLGRSRALQLKVQLTATSANGQVRTIRRTLRVRPHSKRHKPRHRSSGRPSRPT